jgi:hypothetical protein
MNLSANSRWVPAALFTAAFVAMTPQFRTGQLGAGFESIAIARNLARDGAFANPYWPLVTGPTAHSPPVQPLFFAFLIHLFGYSGMFALLVSLCILAAHGLQMALMPYVSELFFRSRWPGIIGACLGIALPIYPFLPHSETVYCAVGLMLFCLLSNHLAPRAGAFAPLACGVYLGALVQVGPVVLPVAATWLGYLLWRKRVVAPARFAVLAFLGFTLALAPWTWRNYRVFHAFVFVRDNFGLQLAVSNNDAAGADFQWNVVHDASRLDPAHNRREADRVLQMGEVNYFRERSRQALDWIRLHPSRFLRLTAARLRLFWFPATQDCAPSLAVSIDVLTVGSLAALVMLTLRRQRIAVFLAAVFALYPLIYYLVEFDLRYRISILWVMLLATGSVMWSIRLPFTRKRAFDAQQSASAHGG